MSPLEEESTYLMFGLKTWTPSVVFIVYVPVLLNLMIVISHGTVVGISHGTVVGISHGTLVGISHGTVVGPRKFMYLSKETSLGLT